MRRMIVAVALVAFASPSMWAGQPGGQGRKQGAPPLQGGLVTAEELAAIAAKQMTVPQRG